MFCMKCGKEIADTASFCRFCGARNTWQVVEEPAPAEEFGTVQEPAAEIPEPVPAEPREPSAEIPEPVSAEPREPSAEIPEPVPAEPREPSAEIPEPVPAEPREPSAEIPEPVPAEPREPSAEIPEPVLTEPQEPSAEIPEPTFTGRRGPIAEVLDSEPPVIPESDLPAEDPQPGTPASEEQADGQPDKKTQRKVTFYMVRTGLLTAVVSLLLIPCTAAFFVLMFLNALAQKTSFPALEGIERGIVNNVLGSELSVILLGAVCLLLILDFFFVNRRYVRRAFLALGITLLITGLVSFGMSLAVGYVVGNLIAVWQNILSPAVPAFSQTGMLFGIGWCVIGAALISIFLCIRALRKKPDLALNRRSAVFPVIVLILHIITAAAVGAGVYLIASGRLPF